MRRVLCTLFIVLPLFAGEARAQLRVDTARIEDGTLVVRGATDTPRKIVTLDRKFRQRSGKRGAFEFHVRHTPFLCRVTLRTGGVQQMAKVDGCVMDDQRMPPPAIR